MKKGFTLVEVIIGIFLVLIVFLGIFGAFHLGLKILSLSKRQLSALSLANQKIENLRNLDYKDVVSTSCVETINNLNYEIETIVQCIDGEFDGKAPSDANNCVCDYKRVKVRVSWEGLFGKEKVILHDIISPKNKVEECEVLAGVLAVSVFDAKGESVDSPSITVKNIHTDQEYFGNLVALGEYEFVLPPATDTYEILVTKENYSLSRTYQIGQIYNGKTIANPENACHAQPIATVLNAQREERSFCIDKLSKFLIYTLKAKAEHIYYVRKVGSDDNDGLSPDTAFLTVQKAAKVAKAGDIVFVGAGNYQEKVEIQNSGTSGKPISFVADTNGTYTGDVGEVIISGKEFGFYIEDKSYIQIYGFKIENTTGTDGAIYIKGSSAKNIEILNNEIANNQGDGIKVEEADEILISHNKIYSNRDGIFLFNSDNSSIIANTVYQNTWDGIKVVSSQQTKVKFNEVFDNKTRGILIYDNSNNSEVSENIVYLNDFDGILVSNHNSSIEILNNISFSNSGTGISFQNNISNANKIISNLIYDNGKSGIYLSQNCDNNEILNNTLFKNQENGILIENCTNNEIKNNIIASSTLAGIKLINSTNIEESYNNLWQNSPNYDGISAGTGSISVDPLFVDPEGSDNILGGLYGKDDSFYLMQESAGQATTSLCVNAGSDLASNLGLDQKTTRTDKVGDSQIVDLGFHYSLQEKPPLPSPPDPFGIPIPETTFDLRGEKSVGKDGTDNPIYKYSTTTQTDSNGELILSQMEWDNYYFSNFSAQGQDLDLILSYPSPMPIYLPPDSTTTVKLGLKAENSLTVNVLDASTTEPISFASVRVYKTGYDQTKLTNEEGKTFFIPLETGLYSIEIQMTGYASSTDSVFVSGDVETTIYLSRL